MSDKTPLTLAPIPPWIKVKVTEGESFKELKALVAQRNLHTVCEEARRASSQTV